MRMQRIFGGFGATDIAGQTPSLRVVGPTGGLQPTPLATALQTVLREGNGYSNLQVDGLWGDCSEKAFQDFYGESTASGTTLDGILQLPAFGASGAKGWGKSNPQCFDGSQPVAVKGPNLQFSPALAVAKAFGVSVPPGVCPSGMSADASSMECKCPAGQFVSTETGKCEAMESPPKLPAATSLAARISQVSFVNKLRMSPTTFDRPHYVLPSTTSQPSSESKTTILPGNVLTSTGPMSVTRQTFDRLIPIRQFASMPTSNKVLVGMGVVAAIAAVVGGVWWMTRDASAVPNCGE